MIFQIFNEYLNWLKDKLIEFPEGFKKNGLEELGPEFDGKVIRMKGNILFWEERDKFNKKLAEFIGE